MLRDMVREFAEREIAPRAEEIDRTERPPVELLRKAAEQGMLVGPIPEAYGGTGLDFVGYTLMVEEVAKHCLSTAITIAIHSSLASLSILYAGDEAQKRRHLPRMAAGEAMGAFALTEPDAGSDPGAIQTRALRAGDGYRLNGVKTWVSNGGLAGVFVMPASSHPAARTGGLSMFVVDAGTPGLTVGYREPTMGLRGVGVHTVYLEDCVLPAEALLGPEDEAWPMIQRVLTAVRLTLAAAALGAAEGALALGTNFAAERKQFGAAIAQKQAIQNYIAETAVDIESLRHLVMYAAWRHDTGREYHREASMAKFLGARVAKDAAHRMLQIHGGYGFSDEYPISRIYRDVRALRLLGGTDEIQKHLVARVVLGEEGVKV